MKGCRRVVLCLLLLGFLFHASISPVLASNIGTDQVLDTFQPDVTIVPKPQLVPQSHSGSVQNQTPRNPDGSVVGSPFENVPDSQLTTEQVAAKYGVSVGQLAKPSTWDNIKAFAGDMYASGKEKWKSFTSWFGGLYGKNSNHSGSSKVGGKGGSGKVGKSGKKGVPAVTPVKTGVQSKSSSGSSCSKSISRTLYESSPSLIQWLVNNTSGAPSAECKKQGTVTITQKVTKKASEFKKSVVNKINDYLTPIKSTVSKTLNYVVQKATVVSYAVIDTTNKYIDKATEGAEKVRDAYKYEWERQALKREIKKDFNITVVDGDTKWTPEELTWTKEVLTEIKPEYYKGFMNLDYIQRVDEITSTKDIGTICGQYGGSIAEINKKQFSIEPRHINISDDAETCLDNTQLPQESKRDREASYKLTLTHEITHAFAHAHPTKFEEYKNKFWKSNEAEIKVFKDGKLVDTYKQSVYSAVNKDDKYLSKYVGPLNEVSRGGKIYKIDIGMGDPDEDFEDAVGFYMLFPEYLRDRSPEKYKYIESLMKDYKLSN